MKNGLSQTSFYLDLKHVHKYGSANIQPNPLFSSQQMGTEHVGGRKKTNKKKKVGKPIGDAPIMATLDRWHLVRWRSKCTDSNNVTENIYGLIREAGGGGFCWVVTKRATTVLNMIILFFSRNWLQISAFTHTYIQTKLHTGLIIE